MGITVYCASKVGVFTMTYLPRFDELGVAL